MSVSPVGQRSGCAVVGGAIIGLLAALVWVVQLATLSDLSGSDAAGNGLAQGFAMLEIFLLWGLLAVLVIISAVAGTLPLPAVLPGVVLLPLSCAAAMAALDLLSDPNRPPFLWPIIVSATVPPLIGLIYLWSVLPPLRHTIPVWFAAGLVWGGTTLSSASVLPMAHVRQSILAQEQIRQNNWAADFARLPADAPLWEWTPLLATRSEVRRNDVLERIRKLDRRQADAETMLDRGDFPLRYLGQFELTPTPAICEKVRALLRNRVERLVLKNGETRPYAAIREPVADAVAAMKWLVGYDCSCDAESLAWETVANTYRDPEWEVYELHDLRDPGQLGRTLREAPERFDMLTPGSHLKAWLHFAEDSSLRTQSLAGARTLQHRTEDAVEILSGTEFEAWNLLIYLPELDLAATPALCAAALREVHRELAQVYFPRTDDPRPYQELLDHLGTGRPFQALIWLGTHGCDSGSEIDEAESLVRAYQDSPERTAMLASLRALPH